MPNRKAAKLKFFAAYFLSVALLFVVLSSFLRIGAVSEGRQGANAVQAKADTRLAIDQLLHRQMERLISASSLYMLKSASQESSAALKKESSNFLQLVDSIHKETSSMDESEKQQVQTILDAFSRQAEKQVELVKTTTTLNRNTPAAGSGNSSAELNELKGILVQKEQKILELETKSQTALQEKDRTIADLQNKLNTQPAAVAQPKQDDGGEWRDKYEKLKSAHDKLKETNDRNVSEANSLKTAYKEVVDDNRRLITQLQSARAGKN